MTNTLSKTYGSLRVQCLDYGDYREFSVREKSQRGNWNIIAVNVTSRDKDGYSWFFDADNKDQ